MRPMPELKVVEIPTDELVEYENNAKLHPHEQVDQIANSIQEFGFNSPILAWHNDEGEPEIVAGHGRLMAARKLGMEKLPVVFLDHMSEEQRRAYILVDNKLTMNSAYDDEILVEELNRLFMFDMSEFGFESGKIEIDDIDLGNDFEKETAFAQELDEANNYVVFQFKKEIDWQTVCERFGLEKVSTRDRNPNIRRYGIGRVVDGEKLLEELAR